MQAGTVGDLVRCDADPSEIRAGLVRALSSRTGAVFKGLALFAPEVLLEDG